MAKFKNIVSLGCFCSPAMEFKRVERRKFSLPFDWLVTMDFSAVLDLIDNNFNGLLEYDDLYQIKEVPSRYRNSRYSIDFYHDFLPVKSFDKQIDAVKEKYNRRIKRFYEIITEPTLFCRYIISRDELLYIAERYGEIVKRFKKYNEENEIMFIVNEDIFSTFDGEIPLLWTVEKDEGDMFARNFLDKNEELKDFIVTNVEKAPILQKKINFTQSLSKAYTKIMLKAGFIYNHNKQI